MPTCEEHAQNLKKIFAVLDKITEKWGRKVKINSAYRKKAQNNNNPNAAKNSQHLYGEALDIALWDYPSELSNLYRCIDTMIKNNEITLGQFIWEGGEWTSEKKYPSWIHISLPTRGYTNQYYRAYKCGPVHNPGAGDKEPCTCPGGKVKQCNKMCYVSPEAACFNGSSENPHPVELIPLY
jgi:hypothetical protein